MLLETEGTTGQPEAYRCQQKQYDTEDICVAGIYNDLLALQLETKQFVASVGDNEAISTSGIKLLWPERGSIVA